MKALRSHSAGNLALVEVAEPKLGENQLLIAPIATGICGTDLEIIDGGVDPAFIRYPITLGHEWVGRVIALGAALSSPLVGTRVVVEGVIPCQKCQACVSGATNICLTYDEIGFTRDGAAAERIVVPADLYHPIFETVSTGSAALVEPAAVVYQGLLRISPKRGGKVLVIGDGTIGLLVTVLVQNFFPESIDLLGIRPEQKDLASQAGATRFLTNKADLHADYDYIIEAAGAIAAVEIAVSHAKRGGKVLLLGYPERGEKLHLGVHDLINNDLAIYASFSYTRNSWRAVVDLLNSGELDLSFIITHRFPLAEWAKALATLRGPTAGARGKVLLELGTE